VTVTGTGIAGKLKLCFNMIKDVEGKVEMELAETFRTMLFGSVADKFCITWHFNLDRGES